MTVFIYRVATVADAADIFAVLAEAAREIPVPLDTLAREEAMYARVRNWARSGESRVAATEAGRVVGFVLAELNQTSRFWGEHEVIDVHYAGVAKSHRGRGIFHEMMRRVLARAVPVTFAVSPQNLSDVRRHLQRLGFRTPGGGANEHRFLWQPGSSDG